MVPVEEVVEKRNSNCAPADRLLPVGDVVGRVLEPLTEDGIDLGADPDALRDDIVDRIVGGASTG
jgi:hypothetical protein